LLLDHFLAAAVDRTLARLGAEAFSFADRAFVPFAECTHFDSPSLKRINGRLFWRHGLIATG
jgi:glutathione S-transferase